MILILESVQENKLLKFVDKKEIKNLNKKKLKTLKFNKKIERIKRDMIKKKSKSLFNILFYIASNNGRSP